MHDDDARRVGDQVLDEFERGGIAGVGGQVVEDYRIEGVSVGTDQRLGQSQQ